MGPHCGRYGEECSAVASLRNEVVEQLAHAYGATHETTRHRTPPLHLTCVLHWPYRKALQQSRRWSHVAVDPCVHEQFQHLLSQMWSEHPEVHFVHFALQSTRYRYPPPHHDDPAAFHHPAVKLPLGQRFAPLLIVAQKIDQPPAAVFSGPQIVA
jgi:hypothetical protein